MNSKECEEQLNELRKYWYANTNEKINQTDINAIEHLMLENQVQQETIKTQKLVIDNLSERIDKAIEYIKTNVKEHQDDDYDITLYYALNQNECDELLEILRGKDENSN